MIAYDGKMRRNYRIDRMENIRVLEDDQEGEEEYEKFKLELPFRTQSMFNMFGEEKEYVTLRCPEYYYYTIEDKFGSNLVPRREKDKNGNPAFLHSIFNSVIKALDSLASNRLILFFSLSANEIPAFLLV